MHCGSPESSVSLKWVNKLCHKFMVWLWTGHWVSLWCVFWCRERESEKDSAQTLRAGALTKGLFALAGCCGTAGRIMGSKGQAVPAPMEQVVSLGKADLCSHLHKWPTPVARTKRKENLVLWVPIIMTSTKMTLMRKDMACIRCAGEVAIMGRGTASQPQEMLQLPWHSQGAKKAM